MAEGGKKLAFVKNELAKMVKEGVSSWDIEAKADELIKKSGGEASFKKVADYRWATCVNVNDGLVHGIPSKKVTFKKGDVVSIDVGLYFKGFHTDTSVTVAIEPDKETLKFLETGRRALKQAILQAKPGKKISDISRAIQETIEKESYNPIKALVGHGVGRNLHEEPAIPCFVTDHTPEIKAGMALAIEVMYALGSPEVVMENDGWTISTRDGKIAALYEETVAVSKNGTFVLTT